MTPLLLKFETIRKKHLIKVIGILTILIVIYFTYYNYDAIRIAKEDFLQEYRSIKNQYTSSFKIQSNISQKFININKNADSRIPIDHFINEVTVPTRKIDSFNVYHYKFDLVTKLEEKCDRNTETLDLVFLVLSFLERRDFRDAIRQTWGAEDRFRVRTVFLMGVDPRNASVREGILQENAMYQDIVLADYEDTYHNNSIKYIMGLDWAARFCSHSKFYILADDDSYFNVRKLLKYLASQSVPHNLIKKYPEIYGDFQNESLSKRIANRKIRFFGGAVFPESSPLRSGKFEISKKEFPYDKYVPFVNGHATMMSRDVIDELLEAARHTRFLWLDDVYFGFLVAWAGIPITSVADIIYSHPTEYGDATFDQYISTHYMPSPEDLLRIWKIQQKRGNA